jgi:high affinity Mn2+ porin
MRAASALAIAIFLAGTPATGADLLVKASVKTLPGKSPKFDWTGFYFGGHIGYAAGMSDWSATLPGLLSSPLTGSLDLFKTYDAFKGTGSFFHGMQAGYNYMLPSRVVMGIESDISFPNTLAGTQVFGSPLIGQASFTDMVLLFGTLRGRVGYVFDHWLAYATAGFAWSHDRLTRMQFTAFPGGGGAPVGLADAQPLWRLGWAAGVGVETPIGHNWTAKLEYLLTDAGRETVIFPSAAQRFDSDQITQSIRLGMNFQFGSDPNSDTFTKGVSGLNLENFSLHGQTTSVSQYALPFRSPYSGPNSLAPNEGRETWDATLFIGVRPWEGGELWINPEIDQGFGLSGTFGVAGFPSAEAYKVGSAYPYARLPRMFFRQTVNLGGEAEKVESGVNQFAGSQTTDRLVITVGKISVVDIFDANKYAHDPHNDFLNWTAVDTGAFDYAADAWAYTYGAVVEWYRNEWTFRAGIFDAPIVPNSTELDPTFQQFQMVGEVERRYAIFGQPGKIDITGFLTRARMGSFEAAIQLAQMTGGPADITAVRTYTSKPGIAGNLEQQIVADVGVFTRAGWNPGKLEPDAFTDADATLAGGVSLGGTLWGRPDDKVGIAALLNTITREHEAYFNAGGLTALLGDGELPHPGPEKILEAYYSLPVSSWRVAFDYQFITNPGYNRDRGPVSVVAARLHTEF